VVSAQSTITKSEMPSKLNNFIVENRGKYLTDQYGLWRGECVSLVKQWQKYNGWPICKGNAIDWIKNGDGKNYRFIPNTPTFVPKGGDIVIFATGKYGHIGVVYAADVKTMNVFQQNDPIGSPAKQKIYNYVKPHCLGFLRKI